MNANINPSITGKVKCRLVVQMVRRVIAQEEEEEQCLSIHCGLIPFIYCHITFSSLTCTHSLSGHELIRESFFYGLHAFLLTCQSFLCQTFRCSAAHGENNHILCYLKACLKVFYVAF